jgi:TM2 domain-containing membrane protein YozV
MSTDMNEDFSKPIPHHISDVETWLHPDRNFYVFIALTFLFGFFGLDHMYLRSNETAFKKLLLNVCGLGIWYFWDIIQVLKDGKYVRQHGLNSPFDWIRGIGRGMFVNTAAKTGGKGGDTQEYAAPKSYMIYTLLAVCLGIFGADKFYVGNTWQGLAKLFSVFNIFLFLFGLLWVVWDAFHAFFMTESILTDNIKPPVPYSWLLDPIDASVFKVQEVTDEPKKAGFSFPWPSLPTLPFRELYRELVVPLLQPTVGTGIQSATKVLSVGAKVAGLGTTALAAGPAFVGNLTSQINQQVDQAVNNALHPTLGSLTAATTTATATTTPAAAEPIGTSVAAVQQVAENAAAQRQPVAAQPQPQAGGGLSTGAGVSSSGIGPVLAGAFTAIVVAGGLKGTFDFFSKQLA